MSLVASTVAEKVFVFFLYQYSLLMLYSCFSHMAGKYNMYVSATTNSSPEVECQLKRIIPF